MTSSLFPDASGGEKALERDVAALERKVAAMIEHVRGLYAANESLRQELAMAQARNRALSDRVVQARQRLDALLARLPDAVDAETQARPS